MFVYNNWDDFCRKLKEKGIISVTAKSQLESKNKEFLVLKHDVEDKPEKALELAKIEAKYGHCGVYYVQAYLITDKNIRILSQIKELGHEVSYHHDVMDANGGNIENAISTFGENKRKFEENGFIINTVCQHGNPIAERNGYYSNRDFFRNEKVKNIYPDISEIMVDYKNRTGVNYKYVSDAGYGWKMIFDPETNDIVNSDDKNVVLGALDNVVEFILENKSVIVSTHPHRWNKSAVSARMKNFVFFCVRKLARVMYKIPVAKKLMEKFYFIAKKI